MPSAEVAGNTAVGAGRGRMLRQLLIESLLLGVAGGFAGLLVARGCLRVAESKALAAIDAVIFGCEIAERNEANAQAFGAHRSRSEAVMMDWAISAIRLFSFIAVLRISA